MRKVINLVRSGLFGANCKLQLLNVQHCSSALQQAQRQRWDQMEPQNHHRVPAWAGDTCKTATKNMKVSEMHAYGSALPGKRAARAWKQ